MNRTYGEMQTKVDEIHADIKILHNQAYEMLKQNKLSEDDNVLFGYLCKILDDTDRISNIIEENYMDKKVKPEHEFPRKV